VGAPCLADFARPGNFGCAPCLPDGFLFRWNCCTHGSHRRSFPPRLDRVGTNLSYCTGEIPPASSNITPYIVGGCKIAPCIAQSLQQMPGLRVERKDGLENRREQDKASAVGKGVAMGNLTRPVAGWLDRRAAMVVPRNYPTVKILSDVDGVCTWAQCTSLISTICTHTRRLVRGSSRYRAMIRTDERSIGNRKKQPL